MYKSFLFSLIAGALVFSILAPPIETLLYSQSDSTVILDFNEEENNQKESDNEYGEKNLFFASAHLPLRFQEYTLSLNQTSYRLLHTNIPQEILSPPPEQLF